MNKYTYIHIDRLTTQKHNAAGSSGWTGGSIKILETEELKTALSGSTQL